MASREAMVMKFGTEKLFDMRNPKMALKTAYHKHIKKLFRVFLNFYRTSQYGGYFYVAMHVLMKKASLLVCFRHVKLISCQ